MNGNIEVINENLWAVNPYHVSAGWIKEVSFPPNQSEEPEKATLFTSKTGIFILNTAIPDYKGVRKLVIMIMNYSDDKLKLFMEKLRESEPRAECDDFLLKLMESEQERRRKQFYVSRLMLMRRLLVQKLQQPRRLQQHNMGSIPLYFHVL
ncbi:MAG: hypothetical protein LUB59_01085 [Candidatus Gastranaerophilales bacterium]|nr:hypothetical protein [Candidatus Gastranaerophilales bacterium]